MDELKALYKIYNTKKVKYPYTIIIPHPRKGILSVQYIVDSRKKLYGRIREIEKAQDKIYKCFCCNKYFKEDVGGRWLPMDKRESGDNGFGYTFVCIKCVPKEYGRL